MTDKYAPKARAAAKRNRRLMACENKRSFASVADAIEQIPTNQEPYRCGHCGFWHRGTKRVDKLKLQMRRAAR